VTTPAQLTQNLDAERIGKVAAQAAALAGADLAYQLAVAQEMLTGALGRCRELDQQLAEKDAQLGQKDAELGRLRTTNERLQQQLVRAESGPDVDVDEDQVDDEQDPLPSS
jgi:hypothetical protein